MKSCELCKSAAKIYCDSDQASLCWTCDTKVHSANFLVARHSRTLLCTRCNSFTPWTGSGEKLGPSTVSVCEKCCAVDDEDSVGDIEDVDEDDDEYDGDEDDETELDYDDDDDDDDENDDNDNQVVPMSFTPPPVASSSSEDDEDEDEDDNDFICVRSVLMKRKRGNVTDLSEDDMDKISGENKSKAVTGEFKGTRTVGFNLNEHPSDLL